MATRMRLWMGPVVAGAAIVVLIVAYLLVSGHPRAPKAASFLGVTVGEIGTLTFHSHGQTLTLYQVTNSGGTGTTWYIGNPKGTQAAQSLTRSFASGLATLQPTRTLTTNPSPIQLKEYGLNPPTASVTIGRLGGRAPVTLNVGVTSPIGGYYAQVGGKPAVYMLAGSVPTEVTASPKAWLPAPSATGASGTASGTTTPSGATSAG